MGGRFKLVTLLGIRPDLIRMHKLIRLLDRHQRGNGYAHVFAHTGQHYDYELDEVFYKQLGVRRPDVNLRVGKTLKRRGGPTTYAHQTALLFERLAGFFEDEKPDAVLYLGDTNTVLSSIVAARQGIPVIHIEGGGRSYDWRMPEEKNRIVIDHLSDMIYCYLPRYRDILLREGVPSYRIQVVGNLIVDAIDDYLPEAERSGIMERLGVRPREFVLFTLHREENTADPVALARTIKALARLTARLRCPAVFPVMPRVRRLLLAERLPPVLKRAKIIETGPLGFLEFLKLERNATLIISDSGTVQEEALILGTPCLVARRSTERPETIRAGATVLSEEHLYEEALRALRTLKRWDRTVLNPFRTSPSERIFRDLVKKINTGFFKKSRSYAFIKNDRLIREAYGRINRHAVGAS